MNISSIVVVRAICAALLMASLPEPALALTPPTGGTCAAPNLPGHEYNTNRYGGDYMRYAVTTQSCPEQCAYACAQDSRCVAWSFVRHDQVDPGCYLKNSVPAPTPNACCVSGLNAASAPVPPTYPPTYPPSYPPVTSTPPVYPPVSPDAHCGTSNPIFEYNTNRYGGDYARYAVNAQSCPQQCAAACASDNRCQAWSFVRHDQVDPGCYLKDSQPAPTANACCVSGTYTRIVDRMPPPPIGGEQPAGNWSTWISRDSPSDSADYENLDSMRGSVPCPQPIAIECRVVGAGTDWRQTGQRYTCALDSPVPGGICVNAENNGACLDYEVRYRCP